VGLQPTWVYRPGATFGYPADAKADWPRQEQFRGSLFEAPSNIAKISTATKD